MALKIASLDVKVTTRDDQTGVASAVSETVEKVLKLAFPTAIVSWAARAVLKAAGADASVDASAGLVTTTTAPSGAAQVETLTAAGAITGSGNLAVTVTAAGVAGSPLAINVPVTNGDSAATWGGKVRTALAANAALGALYTVGGTGTGVVLTRKSEAANDGTLAIQVAAGTATNATLPLTSANTTAGVAGAGTVLSGTIAGERLGVAVPEPEAVQMLLVVVTGGAGVLIGGPVATTLYDGNFMLFAAANSGGLDADFKTAPLTLESSGGGVTTVEVVVISK